MGITDWPTPTQTPRGRVTEILGYEDDFGVDVKIVIRKYHIPHRFRTEVLGEAQVMGTIIGVRAARLPPPDDDDHRRGNRARLFVILAISRGSWHMMFTRAAAHEIGARSCRSRPLRS